MRILINSFSGKFTLIILFFLLSALPFAYTLMPNCDEAWFALPAYNLLENGFFGTTVLDETATFRQVRLDGINHYTYWVMPVFPLAQTVWGKIVGFNLLGIRLLSVIFGIAALYSWAYLIKKLSGNSSIALLSAVLMAIDYNFVYASGIGRMDIMTASLGIGGLAFFIRLREKNFDYAVLAAFTLTALAFFAHPMGLLWFVSLIILIALLDFKRIKFRHFVFAALPYLVFGSLWAIYILQNPDLFFLQFGGNASDRWGFFRAPFQEFWLEIKDRYFFNFGIGEGLSMSGRIRIVVLFFYTMSFFVVLATKSLRDELLPRFLLLIAAQQFFMLLLLDGMKQHYYLVCITPTLTVILGLWLNRLWRQKGKFRVIACVILFLVVIINASVLYSRISRNVFHNNYLPTAEFLNKNTEPSDMIMASSEFWFALERRKNLIDDYRLGYRTGNRAQFIVMDAPRYRDWTNALEKSDAENYHYVQNLLQNDYEIVYEDKVYQIYKQKNLQ